MNNGFFGLAARRNNEFVVGTRSDGAPFDEA